MSRAAFMTFATMREDTFRVLVTRSCWNVWRKFSARLFVVANICRAFVACLSSIKAFATSRSDERHILMFLFVERVFRNDFKDRCDVAALDSLW